MQHSRSDIEEILQSQTWKQKYLEPIQVQKRGFKVRCVTEREKPRKQERFITQPCFTMPESLIHSPAPEPEPVCRNNQPRKSNSTLAAPLPIIQKAILSISSRASSFDFQVPVFPKREFGNSTKSQDLVPKFESLKNFCREEAILEMKLESGRIKKQMPKTQKKRFEFLDDFNHLNSEKAIKRMKTIYLTTE
jgi:hypothetical protein